MAGHRLRLIRDPPEKSPRDSNSDAKRPCDAQAHCQREDDSVVALVVAEGCSTGSLKVLFRYRTSWDSNAILHRATCDVAS